LNTKCKVCIRAESAERRQQKPKESVQYACEYRILNKAKKSASSKAWYEKNKARVAEYRKRPDVKARKNAQRRTPHGRRVGREYMRKRSEAYRLFMATQSCARCGISDPRVLCWHHADPTTKERTVGYLRTHAWETVITEIAKCECLCFNCHNIVHAELRGDFWIGSE
jgi:hypothetical protein